MGSIKIWWVLGGSNYYPGWDNFLGSFETSNEAYEFSENHRDSFNNKEDWYQVINISERLYS